MSVCVCVYVILIQSTSKKPHVSDLSKLDALLHKIQQGPSDTKITRLDICRSIILSGASNVTQSPIKPKKQDNKKSSGGGGWRQRGKGVGKNLKKEGESRQYRGVFIK